MYAYNGTMLGERKNEYFINIFYVSLFSRFSDAYDREAMKAAFIKIWMLSPWPRVGITHKWVIRAEIFYWYQQNDLNIKASQITNICTAS